jgi:chitinase
MMKMIKSVSVVFAMFTLFALIGGNAACTGKEAGVKKRIIAYIFVKDKLVNGEIVAVEKLTHINYAFADIKDGVVVKGFKNDEENFKILNGLKKRNPRLKILISVGGWTWSGNFSDMALTRESRHKFIESAVAFVREYKLDGVDLDWEFPNLKGYGNVHRPEDKENFTLLLKELRQRLDEEGKAHGAYYLSTIAVGAFEDYIKNTEMGKVHKYVDFINVMAYDLYEAEVDVITGHHAALYTHPSDRKKVSVDAAIKSLLARGVPAPKLVLGCPFYGRAWTNVQASNNGLYQQGEELKKRLGTSFKRINSIHLKKDGGFKSYWDEKSSVPYLWNPSTRTFVSYENVRSITEKCKYINKRNLGGAMFWEYHSDYNNQLLTALFKNLK